MFRAGPIGNDTVIPHHNHPPTEAMAAIENKFYDTFALVYGSITVLGGIIGYLKAGSVASYLPSSNTLFRPSNYKSRFSREDSNTCTVVWSLRPFLAGQSSMLQHSYRLHTPRG